MKFQRLKFFTVSNFQHFSNLETLKALYTKFKNKLHQNTLKQTHNINFKTSFFQNTDQSIKKIISFNNKEIPLGQTTKEYNLIVIKESKNPLTIRGSS